MIGVPQVRMACDSQFHSISAWHVGHIAGSPVTLEEADAFVLVRHGQASTCSGISNRQAMPVNLRDNARYLAMLSYCFVKCSPHVILTFGLVQHGSKPSSDIHDACGAGRALPISDLCHKACRNRPGEGGKCEGFGCDGSSLREQA